jgi:hypothetical protein
MSGSPVASGHWPIFPPGPHEDKGRSWLSLNSQRAEKPGNHEPISCRRTGLIPDYCATALVCIESRHAASQNLYEMHMVYERQEPV